MKKVLQEGILPNHMTVSQAYQMLGAETFYEKCGDKYYNPSEKILVEALSYSLDTWTGRGGFLSKPEWEQGHPLERVLDVACGSGEAGLALRSWGAEREKQHGVAAVPLTYCRSYFLIWSFQG